MSIVGQPKHGTATPKSRNEVHCVCSVLTKTGCPTTLVALFSEGPNIVLQALEKELGEYKDVVKVPGLVPGSSS